VPGEAASGGLADVIVHFDPASPREHREDVERVQEAGRFVIVETTEQQLGTWLEAVG